MLRQRLIDQGHQCFKDTDENSHSNDGALNRTGIRALIST